MEEAKQTLVAYSNSLATSIKMTWLIGMAVAIGIIAIMLLVPMPLSSFLIFLAANAGIVLLILVASQPYRQYYGHLADAAKRLSQSRDSS